MEAYSVYRENEIMTNHPVENTILMYENCIKRLRLVKRFYETYKYSQADEEIERVEQLVEELKLQVDESVNVEFAEDLYRLYAFILDSVFKIYKFRTIEPIAEIEKVLKDLIEAFRGAMKIEEDKRVTE